MRCLIIFETDRNDHNLCASHQSRAKYYAVFETAPRRPERWSGGASSRGRQRRRANCHRSIGARGHPATERRFFRRPPLRLRFKRQDPPPPRTIAGRGYVYGLVSVFLL